MSKPDSPAPGAPTPGTINPGTLSTPVPTRSRHDGWTPERQHDFIAALAESGCVAEACAAVGISARSAYRLRARPDASIFRQAWDVALDYAVRRLADAAFSRALHGVARPVFYQGEQIGERRHYDERLTMFLLRYRDPVRYGAWLDGYEARRHPDGAGIVLAHALNAVLGAAYAPDDAAPEDDDSSDEDQPWDPDADRPLAEGPPPPDRRPLPDYDGPEHLRELAEMLHAAGHQDDFEFHDPAADDWRSALLVNRPRRDSKRDVP